MTTTALSTTAFHIWDMQSAITCLRGSKALSNMPEFQTDTPMSQRHRIRLQNDIARVAKNDETLDALIAFVAR